MSKPFDVEEVDLDAAARHLRSVFARPLEGAVVGRTLVRDALIQHLECSELDAELVVDTMVGRGFLTLHHNRDGSEAWYIQDGD